MPETLRRYCQCGASCSARSTPRAAADFVIAEFERIHIGAGHGRATAREASRARRREEAR